MYINVSMHMLERVRERDLAPMVCVIGLWVALVFSIPYYTHHRCPSMFIVQK